MLARYECPECRCWFWVDEDPMELAESDLCPDCQEAPRPPRTRKPTIFEQFEENSLPADDPRHRKDLANPES